MLPKTVTGTGCGPRLTRQEDAEKFCCLGMSAHPVTGAVLFRMGRDWRVGCFPMV